LDNDPPPRLWKLYIDGSSTKDESGAILMIESLAESGTSTPMFKASNNEVEYEALIARVELCYTAGATRSEHSLTSNWWLASSRGI